jgi:hypothetical protein
MLGSCRIFDSEYTVYEYMRKIQRQFAKKDLMYSKGTLSQSARSFMASKIFQKSFILCGRENGTYTVPVYTVQHVM